MIEVKGDFLTITTENGESCSFPTEDLRGYNVNKPQVPMLRTMGRKPPNIDDDVLFIGLDIGNRTFPHFKVSTDEAKTFVRELMPILATVKVKPPPMDKFANEMIEIVQNMVGGLFPGRISVEPVLTSRDEDFPEEIYEKDLPDISA
jgi:hypothetical protein